MASSACLDHICIGNHMDESAILEKIALTTVQLTQSILLIMTYLYEAKVLLPYKI